MKKFLSIVLALVLVLTASVALADKITIAIPNDNTNMGRALQLLAAYGYIQLPEGLGVTATVEDIIDNPYEFVAVEAAMVANVREDVDYAIINSNYALDANLVPADNALAMEAVEGNDRINVVCVREGNEETDLAKALAAAMNSQQVADFITANYNGSVIPSVLETTDGYDPTVDYDALNGQTIKIAASPTPHAAILTVARDLLAEKGITLEIIEYSDYVQPNMATESGDVFANYFAHQPYQDDFNAENGTHLVTIAAVHLEPMGLYGGKQTTLDALTIK